MSLSSPTRALPVALMRFSPLAVSGRSVVPVWRPFRDHSVSPWRTMKQRGAIGIFSYARALLTSEGSGSGSGSCGGAFVSSLTG